jgi:hypothetical protein
MGWQGKPEHLDRTCPTAALSTTDPGGFHAGSKPGRRGEKPVPNRQSYNMDLPKTYISCFGKRIAILSRDRVITDGF